MTPAIQSNSSTSGLSGDTPSSTPQTGSTGVDKNMFLQLMVAQLRNQDPLNPSDGTQFVAQLAQFQQLEQTLNMGQDIAAMRLDLDQISSAAYAATTQV